MADNKSEQDKAAADAAAKQNKRDALRQRQFNDIYSPEHQKGEHTDQDHQKTKKDPPPKTP